MTELKCERVLLLGILVAITFVSSSSINAATIQYEYDALNRLIRVIYDENTSIEYTYDAVGNRTQRVATASSENGSYHPGDANADYVISISEIVSYINEWAAGEVSISDVVKAINLWAAGHYYWDPDDGKFKPGTQPSLP